jgi:cardiolipin synthase
MLWAQGIFVLCVLSDAIDGALARVRGERTALGTFLDPAADKLLMVSTYITLTYLGLIPAWAFITVVSRDLIILLGWSVVYILTGNSKVEPRLLGKLTTVMQMATAITRLFDFPVPVYHAILHTMIAITILSAFDYIWVGNKRLGTME